MNARRYYPPDYHHDTKEELFYRMAVVIRYVDIARERLYSKTDVYGYVRDVLTIPFQLLLNQMDEHPEFSPTPEMVADLKATIG